MKIKPLADRIVVKPLEAEEKTKGGLFVPDTAKERPQQGEVVAVGPGRTEDGKKIPPEVKVGDKVLYTKPWNDPVKVAGVEYYLVSESEILAIIK